MTATLPVTGSDVQEYLGVTASQGETVWIEAAAAAASQFAARYALGTVLGPEPVPVGADVRLGAVILAGRWFQRRNSLAGVAAFSDFGPAYVKQYDPDAALLLGMFRPGVG